MKKIVLLLSALTILFYISGCLSTQNSDSNSQSGNSQTTGFKAECKAECMNKASNSSCFRVDELPNRITAPSLVQIVRFWCPNTSNKYGIR